jgi:hypothetical protein
MLLVGFGDEVPVCGMFVSSVRHVGGAEVECETAAAKATRDSNPPTAEGAIRLGIESSIG